MTLSRRTLLCSALFLITAHTVSLGAVKTADGDSRVLLSGTVSLGNDWLFHLHDKQESHSFWLSLGEERRGVRAVSYDKTLKALTVSIDDKLQILDIEGAVERPLPVKESRVLAGFSESEVPEAPNYTPTTNPPNGGMPPISSPPARRPIVPESLKR
jgi:hypothetical protein